MEDTLAQRYKIIKNLGSGGFGETFLAQDLQMPSTRKVVIKKLKPINQNNISIELIKTLFQKEAKVLEELGQNCSEIPTLYAYFQEEEDFYLVQEYIEGKSLAELGVINPNQCESILLSLLNTLKYVHGKNIIHRDIKPENIILRDSDKQPVLIDFGAVKETIGAVQTNSSLTVSSVIFGTRGFIPLEQSMGRTVFSSDLYALSLTIIYSLTGKYPIDFPNNNITGELDWQSYIPHLSSNLKTVLEKALKTDATQRYPTAEAMYEALRQSQAQTIAVIPVGTTRLTEKTSNLPPTELIPNDFSNQVSRVDSTQITSIKNNILVILITAVLVALGISGGFFIMNRANIFSSTNIDKDKEPNNSTSEKEPLSPTISPKYQKLETELKNGNWQEADLETNKIMLSLVGRENEANFTTTSIDNLPCEDLKTINELWLKYSQQKFGFTTQKEIYLSTGNNIGEYKTENYSQFVQQIGWNNYDLGFTEDVPKGHLPAPLINGYDDVWHDDVGLLFTRLQACDL